KTRHDVQPGKRDGRADAQTPRQACGRAARSEFGFVGFLDGPSGALVEIPSRLGRLEPMGRTEQQAHPEPLLELRDRLGNCGLAARETGRAPPTRTKVSMAAMRPMGHSLGE